MDRGQVYVLMMEASELSNEARRISEWAERIADGLCEYLVTSTSDELATIQVTAIPTSSDVTTNATGPAKKRKRDRRKPTGQESYINYAWICPGDEP